MNKKCVIVLTGFVGFASATFADVLHLERGGQLEGVVVRETTSMVTLDVGMGEISVPRTAIKRVERKQSPLSEFRARLAITRPSDLRASLDLARFASQNGLNSEARQMWSRVLSLDPRNVEAHLALGHVLLAGTYVDETEANRANGLVHFDGRWMTPSEQSSLLRERERRAAENEQVTRARRAARDAEDEARRARAEVARSRAAESRTTYPVWGYGGPVIVGSPHFGGYVAGCTGAACYTVPQIWPTPSTAPRTVPAPRAQPLRPSSIW